MFKSNQRILWGALFFLFPFVTGHSIWLHRQPLSIFLETSLEKIETNVSTASKCSLRCFSDFCYGYTWNKEDMICKALEAKEDEPILLGAPQNVSQTWLKSGQIKRISRMHLYDRISFTFSEYFPSQFPNSTVLQPPNFLEFEAFPIHHAFDWGILMCAAETQICKKWIYGSESWEDAPSLLRRHEVFDDSNQLGLINNNFWVIGGFGQGRKDSHTEYLTPDGQWVLGPDLPHTLNMFGMAPISDSQVLIAGGSKSGAWGRSVRIYDLFYGTWVTVGSYPQILVNLGCAQHTLQNGKKVVLCTGGRCRPSMCNSSIDALGWTSVYDIDSGTWNLTPEWNLPVNCKKPRVRVLDDNLLIMGGIFEDGKDNRVLKFNENETPVWQELEPLPFIEGHVISGEYAIWQP